VTDSGNDEAGRPGDAFTSFWSDFMSKLGMPAGMAAAVPPTADLNEQMKTAFFEALSRYCDEFMRSEQFLTAMRQSMDGALAFRQQLDRFLTSTIRAGQQPAREDTDHLLLVLRSMEERVMDRLEDLDRRLGRLEAGRSVAGARPTPKRRAAAKSAERRTPAAKRTPGGKGTPGGKRTSGGQRTSRGKRTSGGKRAPGGKTAGSTTRRATNRRSTNRRAIR